MHGLFFDVRPKPGHMPHYFDHVGRLKPILARHRGLLYLERFRPLDDPDALLSHQFWQDEAALAAWRRDATHRVSQSAGRTLHFEDYRIRVGAEERALADDAGGRFLVAAYGSAAMAEGRAFESVTRPARFVTLAEAGQGADARAVSERAQGAGAEEVRIFRIARDYTLTDRAEAPARD